LGHESIGLDLGGGLSSEWVTKAMLRMESGVVF